MIQSLNDSRKGSQLNKSRFNMWRAVVAMVHADGVVTPHELAFINSYMAERSLTSSQSVQIAEDLKTPQDIFKMFDLIDSDEDRRDFFSLARALSWCDGDFAKQEERILKKLELNDDSQLLLQESREDIAEIELCENQWVFKTERSKSLFGFLRSFNKAA